MSATSTRRGRAATRVGGAWPPWPICTASSSAHHEEPHVAAHLLASQPHGTYLEVFHPDRDPIWWQMIANRPELEDGKIALPTAPGFGWELDRDFIERYRISV